MSPTGKFVEEHPFLTFFIAMAAIDGVVAIVKTLSAPACPDRAALPGHGEAHVSLGSRWPFVECAPLASAYDER